MTPTSQPRHYAAPLWYGDDGVKCAGIAREYLCVDTSSRTTDVAAADLVAVQASLREVSSPAKIFGLIHRVDLRPGSVQLTLDAEALANLLGVLSREIESKSLTIEAPFQMRRRGVELKLHLDEAPAEIDQALIRKTVKARTWLKMIIDGQTFTEIVETESSSKRRIQSVIELALLAPGTLDAIGAGEQPLGLTSDCLIKTGFSAIWTEQHEQFVGL